MTKRKREKRPFPSRFKGKLQMNIDDTLDLTKSSSSEVAKDEDNVSRKTSEAGTKASNKKLVLGGIIIITIAVIIGTPQGKFVREYSGHLFNWAKIKVSQTLGIANESPNDDEHEDANEGENNDENIETDSDGDSNPEAGEREEYSNFAEQLRVVKYDINFSQVEGNFESKGVQVLIKIKNENSQPIGRVTFMIKQGDNIIKNNKSNQDYFAGDGYIEGGETGYIYAHIYMDNKTKKNQGEIVLVDAQTCKPWDDYQMATGYISGFDKLSDSYSIKITNPNPTPIKAKESVAIAVLEGTTTLESSWGAGELAQGSDRDSTKVIGGNETVELKNIIYNPGFKEYPKGKYRVFVIEKSSIDTSQ